MRQRRRRRRDRCGDSEQKEKKKEEGIKIEDRDEYFKELLVEIELQVERGAKREGEKIKRNIKKKEKN